MTCRTVAPVNFVATINAIHQELPQASIEVLISDLKGQFEPLVEIMQAKRIS